MTFQKLLEPQRGREEMEASGGPGLRGHRQEAQGTGESEMGQGGMEMGEAPGGRRRVLNK